MTYRAGLAGPFCSAGAVVGAGFSGEAIFNVSSSEFFYEQKLSETSDPNLGELKRFGF